jgi:flagellin-like protein
MVVTRKNDEAVSPVIGVILMVAITVILAAVIAAFVFGMSGNIQKTKVVAATVSQPDGTHIIITYNGGQDSPTLAYGTITVTPATTGLAGLTYTNVSGTAVTNNIFGPVVGTSVTYSTTTANGFSGQDHVVVTALFTDGAQQVILDSYV